ncbi:MAG: DNA mismatch repair endonuclease MutL [Bacteroidetes bacterium]|nr:MAG: DNA mismatch repair endonuclease MutL [Bacteroidota bacterium]
MTNTIQLLPDNIANQIAAGEVIQRPASAVKELLENAVDAHATQIQLIVIDAGKTLIQVIDNGKGMSPTDARLCFERHATSKIKKIDDLFHIKTMGFRGEALASIAAVAQVVLKTKQGPDELGTLIEIENSVVQKQEPCATVSGTSISMKNLFFNVPARRNFLKSNATELKVIIDEFVRVAMAFPAVQFSLTHNNQQIFFLESGNLKQRLVQMMGNTIESKLIPVKESTDYVTITGFVGKPDISKKSRGDQYFFVNNRFIKSAYLHHAVMMAFSNLLQPDTFPMYALFIEVNPSHVDINVHPTKQEIKFDDEKIMHHFVQAAVKHALAQYSVMPSLDFSLDAPIQQLDAFQKPFTQQQQQATQQSNIYQGFTRSGQAHFIEPTTKSNFTHWDNFLDTTRSSQPTAEQPWQQTIPINNTEDVSTQSVVQILNTYIVAKRSYGFLLINQQLAHERILFEKFQTLAQKTTAPTQQVLFPVVVELSATDAVLLQELLPYLKAIGYTLTAQKPTQYLVEGVPADLPEGNEKHTIELLLEQMKHHSADLQISRQEKLYRSLARQQAKKNGTILSTTEMKELVAQLFQCYLPHVSPSGSPTYVEFREDYLDKLFVQ